MEHLKQPNHTIEDYWALPEGTRAELIDGVFYDMSAPSRLHQRFVFKLAKKIDDYIEGKGGSCEVDVAPFAVQLLADQDDIVEPDISVICDPDKLTDRGCVGAPDWIIEIVSPSSGKHDYIRKLNLYSNAGVREYWIVDPDKERVLVYHLEEQGSEFVYYYTFQDEIPVYIYEDLVIDIPSLINDMNSERRE